MDLKKLVNDARISAVKANNERLRLKEEKAEELKRKLDSFSNEFISNRLPKLLRDAIDNSRTYIYVCFLDNRRYIIPYNIEHIRYLAQAVEKETGLVCAVSEDIVEENSTLNQLILNIDLLSFKSPDEWVDSSLNACAFFDTYHHGEKSWYVAISDEEFKQLLADEDQLRKGKWTDLANKIFDRPHLEPPNLSHCKLSNSVLIAVC